MPNDPLWIVRAIPSDQVKVARGVGGKILSVEVGDLRVSAPQSLLSSRAGRKDLGL